MITIYTIAYNEEMMLPYFIHHYRSHFPGCRIVVYSNESTDGTDLIAKQMDCEVIIYSTNGKLSDEKYLDIKNNCWKDAKTEWVLIADVDEHCVINDQDLRRKEYACSIVKFQGWNMVNTKQSMNIGLIDQGIRAESYDKYYLFKRTMIDEINYNPGCHSASPKGDIIFSANTYPCRHYKYINPDYMVERHKLYASRLSEDNLKKGYGFHYLYPEEKIRKEFQDALHKVYSNG